jgi:hypothetical protein
MKKRVLLLVLGLLLLLVGCSDHDDQPGRARATSALDPEPTAVQATTEASSSAADPSPMSESGGWVWVRVGMDLNPEQRPIEVCKGDIEGSCTRFAVSGGGCAIQKVELNTQSKIYDYEITCSCDTPPGEVWPGEEYRLRATCSGDLKYAAEGNSWIQGQGAVAYYYMVNPAHKQFLQPFEQQFWFRPWHPDYDGTTGVEWVFWGPWGELGDEFELVARCGEAPCTTLWKYELRAMD